MGVIDRFLNAMKLNDEESFGEDDYLDEDYEEEEQEVQPKKHILKKLEEEEDEEEFIPQASVASSERTSSATRTAAKPKVVRTNPSSKISPMRQRKTGAEKSGEMEVCVIKPRSMEDAREITETLLQDCTVVLNLEGLDVELAQRIIDFSSGSCYAIGGGLQKVSSYIFILTPSTVEISGDIQDLLNGAMPTMRTAF